jgi:prepilin-type N-terminal cleavage/methylation domain
MYRLRAQRGVTLIEALVVLLVGTIAMLALYGLVDASNKLTKQETEVADVQQSARIGISELSRIIRQSRVGGLYFGNAVLPIANNGVLLPNADLVSYGGLPMTDLSGTPHSIRPGTDVIEVRGVILGDKYILDEGDTPGSCCDTPITVTIPAAASLGFVNFDVTHPPSLAAKTKPFYFVVQDGENQQVTIGGLTYLVPIYVVGLVNATGTPCTLATSTWCTLTATTLTFTMHPEDGGARKLNATTTLPKLLGKSVGGGAVDVVRFFVDDRGDTHPSLAEAIWNPDPSTPGWDIQTLIEEVEDFQIAYGVDGIKPGSAHDGGVSPAAVDQNVVNNDEWVGNVTTEIEASLPNGLHLSVANADHSGVDAFLDTSVPPATEPQAVPALRSVWISLVVKSTDPDLVYDGPGARGIRILDSTAVSFSAATGRPYRRRSLSLAVSLRNNAFFNK